ncbi:agmatine deiminase family protein [Pseudorhodobacter sp. E13]|uniref:agmatine deiminase family protein n=1 Tax=Pseudorhodobacter sp. E13 TaxID=2487931 RepID=UPI000F8D99E0|nr:agmatine deiminase family protein [Pseudorhodobacter sp. E13]RUS60068.1 agmatine deiminase family protein [Pseudorhodobacter sp. E13]
MQRRNVLKGAAAGMVMGMTGAPVLAGQTAFVVPPEEAKHQRSFLQWPVSTKVHPDPVFRDMIQQTIADIANRISAFEPVTLLMAAEHQAAARKKLSGAVEIWDIATDDLWCRDAGPLFAKCADGSLVISHIQFNGWGGKQVHGNDGKIAAAIAARLGVEVIASGLVGEAGGVEHDGHGLLVAHESSWVNGNRNPGLSRDEIGARLLAAFGAERIIWTPGVKGLDITDYHIDSLARFTGPGRMLINLPDDPDPDDPFHAAALETRDRLEAAGVGLEVIPEPAVRRVEAEDFVASYANYYVCNDAVIAAEFGDAAADALAREALLRAYPGREVVMLNVDPLGETGGGIHCATQQMPA